MSAFVTSEEDNALVLFPPLTTADRSCANPSAQALVRVAKGSTDLLFDGHAYALAEAALIGDGWIMVEDIRGTLRDAETLRNTPKSDLDTSDH